MVGETDLGRLIATMRPALDPETYVFAAVPEYRPEHEKLQPIMVFREAEAVTLVLTETAARAAGLEASFRCRRIVLTVHSSLEAVGFLAAVTTRLAEAGMGVNPVSAFYHDHLFVPADRADEAMRVLEEMALSSPRIRGEDS